MKKEFEVVSESTANGIWHTVYVRIDGKCIDSKLFHPRQKGKNLVGTARERCEAYCAALRADGYEETVPRAVKDFREAVALINKVYDTPAERRAAMESVLAAMPTKGKTTAQDRYNAKNLRQFMVKINRATEPELLEYLESKDNVQGYIKSLIRADLERHQTEE